MRDKVAVVFLPIDRCRAPFDLLPISFANGDKQPSIVSLDTMHAQKGSSESLRFDVHQACNNKNRVNRSNV